MYGVEGPDGWRPFLERKDILVWRRNHPSIQVKFLLWWSHWIVLYLQGMYEYKMYGSFSDVTAEEFLFVQNDLSKFRLSWDNRYHQLFWTAENHSRTNYVLLSLYFYFLIISFQHKTIDKSGRRRKQCGLLLGNQLASVLLQQGLLLPQKCPGLFRPTSRFIRFTAGWPRDRHSGLHLIINRSSWLQGI